MAPNRRPLAVHLPSVRLHGDDLQPPAFGFGHAATSLSGADLLRRLTSGPRRLNFARVSRPEGLTQAVAPKREGSPYTAGPFRRALPRTRRKTDLIPMRQRQTCRLSMDGRIGSRGFSHYRWHFRANRLPDTVCERPERGAIFAGRAGEAKATDVGGFRSVRGGYGAGASRPSGRPCREPGAIPGSDGPRRPVRAARFGPRGP